ncbi:MAG: DUF3531 family protein [Cyanobacteria bacterium J06627_28]
MEVRFRECDFFNLWIWLEFDTVPSIPERQYVEEILNSWFFIGKLGGFNAENIQVQETGVDISYFDYDQEASERSLLSLMHNMAEVEFQGLWSRCWFDLGTTDALALDVLVNTMQQFSKDYVEIRQIVIGGENEDWPTPHENPEAAFPD